MIAPENSPLKDPRPEGTFVPHFFPLADLADFPVGNPEKRNDRVRLEFLIIYYEINLASARLLDAEGQNDPEQQCKLKSELDSFQVRLEQLEDYYAPLGVIAEPTMAKGFAVNVTFTFPDESRWFHEQAMTGPRKAELKFSKHEPGTSDVAEK